jgi:AcrR family transcriptional regulator
MKTNEGEMKEAPASNARGDILDAAERLFVEYGYNGASMRQITREANVNLAAINYYFSSKEGLIREVLRRRLGLLNEERLRALDALEAQAGGQPLRPSQIVDAFFGTLLRMAGREPGGITFLRLLGRIPGEPAEFIRAFLAQEYREVMERYKNALFRALPGVPRAEIIWRVHFMLGATSYAIAGTSALRLVIDWGIEGEDSDDRLDHLLPRLMSFMLGGLRAPLPILPGGPRGAPEPAPDAKTQDPTEKHS